MTEFGFETRQIHSGEFVDPTSRARITPIYQTAGYLLEGFDDAQARFNSGFERQVYARSGNPTNEVAEQRLADLEGGVGALLTASGQSAIFIVLAALASSGDHILATSSLYGGTKRLFTTNLARQGLEFGFIDADAPDEEWDAAITERTRVIFTETIPNPKNDIPDLERLGRIAAEHGVVLVVDNTVATPYLTRPIEWGAHVVVHSTSKWLAGHGSVVGGAIIDSGRFDWQAHAEKFPQLTTPPRPGAEPFASRFGEQAFIAFAGSVISDYGPTAPPTSTFLLLQGIETLSLRIERHVDNARRIAEWLEEHPDVVSVDYPSLPSSPHHARAAKYTPRGSGSVLAFELRGGREAARPFIDSLRLVSSMTHIGDVRSLALHTGSTIHGKLTEEERLAIGITPGLIRLSIGLETVDDLIRDLEQALAAAHP